MTKTMMKKIGMKKTSMKKTGMMIALATVTLLSACGTVQGVASDAWGAGKFVARQF